MTEYGVYYEKKIVTKELYIKIPPGFLLTSDEFCGIIKESVFGNLSKPGVIYVPLFKYGY
jgi:hypothetical protein